MTYYYYEIFCPPPKKQKKKKNYIRHWVEDVLNLKLLHPINNLKWSLGSITVKKK